MLPHNAAKMRRHAKCDSYPPDPTFRSMFRYRFLRSAAVALGAYGLLGLFISAAMLVVGTTTFGQVQKLQATLENERVALVQSIRTVSGTLQDTAGATADFKRSIDSARGAADCGRSMKVRGPRSPDRQHPANQALTPGARTR